MIEEHGEYRDADLRRSRLNAARLVGRPIFFAMAIIILAFVPVFALTGMEGKLFHPLAFTKTFAMVGSTIIAVTLVPVLCTFLIRGRLHRGRRQSGDALLARDLCARHFALRLRHRVMTLGVAAAPVRDSRCTWRRRSARNSCRRWMKKRPCGCPITDPSISLTKATESDAATGPDHRRRIRQVEMVVGKIGRAETSTDPAPINMSETIVTFKPKEQWPAGLTKDAILQRLDDKAANAGRDEYLDAADSQSHRHAVHRNPHAGWREGVRTGSDDHRKEIRRDRTRSARCARRGRISMRSELPALLISKFASIGRLPRATALMSATFRT